MSGRVAYGGYGHNSGAPRRRPRLVPKERELQCAVADLLSWACRPMWRWSHFPAGELRHPVVGEQLQRMGLQAGWPDLIIFSPRARPHFLELKRDLAGADLSPAQEDFRDWCFASGAAWALHRTIEDATEQLAIWGCIDGDKVRIGA